MRKFVAVCIACVTGFTALTGCSSKSTTTGATDGGTEGGIGGGGGGGSAATTCTEAGHKSPCPNDQLSASEMTDALKSCNAIFQIGCGTQYAATWECIRSSKCGASGTVDAASCATQLQALQTCAASKTDAGGGGGGGGSGDDG